jgi:hypothetical protein
MQSHGSKSLQHYQCFNEVRKDWVQQTHVYPRYPAATGIGVKTGPFSIDVLVQASHPDLDKKGLSTPINITRISTNSICWWGMPCLASRKTHPF